MRLHDVPPRQGFLWVRGAFRILLRQPLGFAGLFTSCFLVLLIVGFVPIAGMLMYALLPTIALLFMIATRRAIDDLPVLPGAFMELARAGRARLLGLLKLGLVCGAAMLLILWIGDVIDGGAFRGLQQSAGSSEDMARHFSDPAFRTGLLARFGLMALVSIPVWHAPALVFWGEQPWARAFVFSAWACWRNKGAFLVYALGWMSVWVVMMLVFSVLLGLSQSNAMAFVILPITLAFWTAIGTSLYFTFADCFDPDDASVIAAAA